MSERKQPEFSPERDAVVGNIFMPGTRVDLSLLDDEKLNTALEEFRRRFNEIKPQARTEILEQFIGLSVISEEEVQRIVRGMTGEQRSIIGEYIGKTINPALYPHVFHDCWHNLNPNLKGHFIKKFTQERPADIFMVAPFVDMARYVFADKDAMVPEYKETRYQHDLRRGKRVDNSSEQSIIERYFNSFETAKKLFEECLRFPGDAGIQAVAEYYEKKGPYFLFPYLPKLIEEGVTMEDCAVKGIVAGRRDLSGELNFPFLDERFFLTKEEDGQLKKIHDKIAELNPKQDKKYKGSSNDIALFERQPRNLFHQYGVINDRAKMRALAHVFSNFGQQRDWYSKDGRPQFFSSLNRSRLPVLAFVNELQLSQGEVKQLIADGNELGDSPFHTEQLLEAKALIKGGMEDVVVRQFLRDIVDEGNFTAQRIVENIDDFDLLLNDKNQKMIIKMITTHAPHAWVYRLDYVLEHKVITLPKLLSSIKEQGWQFFDVYRRLLHEVEKLNRQGIETGIKKDEVMISARNFFKQEPHMVFFHKDIFCDVFTEKEQYNLLKEALQRSPDVYFLDCFLENLSSKDKMSHQQEYLEDIRVVFRNNRNLFAEFIEAGYFRWKYAIFLFPVQERFSLFFASFSNLNLYSTYLFDDESFVKDFVAHSPCIRGLIERLKKAGAVSALACFFGEAGRLLERDKEGRKPKAGDYDKRHRLPDNLVRHLQSSRNKLQEVLTEVCKIEPALLFKGEIRGHVKELGLEKLFAEHISDVVRIQPELFNDIDVKRLLDDEQYTALVRDNMRSVAFLRRHHVPSYDENKMSKDCLVELEGLNPLIRVERRKELPEDYYETVLKELSDNPFLSLYRARLEKIAVREQEKNGPRTNLLYFTPDDEFFMLATRLSVLASSPEVAENQDKILSLPEHQREEIVKLLEFILILGLDRENKEFLDALSALDTEGNVGEKLTKIIFKHLVKTFDLPEEEQGSGAVIPIDADTGRALVIYYNQTCRDHTQLRPVFREYVISLLRGEHLTWRQGDLIELRKQGILPKKLTAEQYAVWNEDMETTLEEVLRLNERDIQNNVNKILAQAIADHHIQEQDIKHDGAAAGAKYDVLCLPMQEWASRLQELKKVIHETKKAGSRFVRPGDEEEYKNLQRKIAKYKEEHDAEITRAEAELYLSHLRLISTDELAARTLQVGRTKVPFSKVFRVLEQAFAKKHPDFCQDVRRIQSALWDAFENMFGKSRVSRSKLRLTDKIDAGVYLKIGEVPVPSCQSYRSDNDFNQGLFSYMADANVKIIQMYDESNRIIARSVLRILEDDKGKPQLFIERIYSVNAHHKIIEAIVNFAKTKARQLGISLFSHSLEGMEELDDVETVELHSRGSRSPYVYTDAGGGRKKNGQYTIRNAFRIA